MGPKPREWKGSAAASKPDQLLDGEQKEPIPEPTKKEKLKAFLQVHFGDQFLDVLARLACRCSIEQKNRDGVIMPQGCMTGCIIHT